jgi:hypothetical protein
LGSLSPCRAVPPVPTLVTMLYLLEVTTISLEVEVNIKVLHDDPLQNVEEAYMLVGDREAEVPIFEIRDMKGRYHTLKACMQHKIDQ